MSTTILYTTDGDTSTGYREATLNEIMIGARLALSMRVRKGTVFSSPRITPDYLIARLGLLQHEVFSLIERSLFFVQADPC
jgi:hypothetical protein